MIVLKHNTDCWCHHLTMAAAEKKAEAEGRPSLGKIRLDAACLQGGGGGCPAEKLLYVIFGIIGDIHVCNCL